MKYLPLLFLAFLLSGCSDENEVQKPSGHYILTDATPQRGSMLAEFSIDGTLREIYQIDKNTSFEFDGLTPPDAIISNGKAYVLAHPFTYPNTIHEIDLSTSEIRSVEYSSISPYCCTAKHLLSANGQLIVDGVADLTDNSNPYLLIINPSTLLKEDSIKVNELHEEIDAMEVIGSTLFIMNYKVLVAYDTKTWESHGLLNTDSQFLGDLFADADGDLIVLTRSSVLKYNAKSFELEETLPFNGWSTLKYDFISYNSTKDELFSITPSSSGGNGYLTKLDLAIGEKDILLLDIIKSSSLSFDNNYQLVLIGGYEGGYNDENGELEFDHGLIAEYETTGDIVGLIQTGDGTGQVRFLKEY